MAKSKHSRPVRQRLTGKRFIIVCEGKTELKYFQAIRRQLGRLSIERIDVSSPASDPRSIVTEAVQKKLTAQREGDWTEEDSAWAVFDGDEHI